MRILAFTLESYPNLRPASFVLLHQSMALEDMGHEVHLYNLSRRPIRLTDYLDAYDFDLVIVEVEFLRGEELFRSLRQYRRTAAVRMVGALYSLPPPPPAVWELFDFTFTPWKGRTVSELVTTVDLRSLPLGYSAQLHRRSTDLPPLGPVFVGNAAGELQAEADRYLRKLRDERVVLCIGPGFEQKYMDPFMLGRIYAAARCLPNFHHGQEKGEDLILNERFWQSARCGIPVNDHHALMDEVWHPCLVREFCFDDLNSWQERIRLLNSGQVSVPAEVTARLDEALKGQSYHDRMRQLLEWLL